MNFKRTAFTLRELAFSVAGLSALAAVSIPALSQVRMDSMRQGCIANYKFISSLSGSYINDNAGKMWALNWKAGMQNPTVPNVQYFATDSEAQGYQAVLTYRRLSGFNATQAPVPGFWFPQILNAHAALLEYVNQPFPSNFMVCPADFVRQNYAEGIYKPYPASGGDNTLTTWRWIFSSSYRWDVYQWSPSRMYRAMNPQGQIAQSPMFFQVNTDANLWDVDGDHRLPGALGPKPATDVRFPSNKVFLSDEYARHGKTKYYAYKDAGQDLLFHDGSVRYYRTDSTNPGWYARRATNRGSMTTRFAHTKQSDVFGNLDGGAASASFAAGWYRWTRGGLQGWDVPRLTSMVGKLPSPTVVENELNTGPETGTW